MSAQPRPTDGQNVTLAFRLLAFLESGGEHQLDRARNAFERMPARWRTSTPEGTVLAFAIAVTGAMRSTAGAPVTSDLREAAEVFKWGAVRAMLIVLEQNPAATDFVRFLVGASER